jgi:small subunit ribosomal protein S8e
MLWLNHRISTQPQKRNLFKQLLHPLFFMITQSRSKRMISGGRYKRFRKKRLFDSGSYPALTRIGKRSATRVRVLGRNFKERLLVAEVANVLDKKTGKYAPTKIKTVVECPADSHYIRRNILVKGAVIETDLGKARITNRPGQEGAINAVLI